MRLLTAGVSNVRRARPKRTQRRSHSLNPVWKRVLQLTHDVKAQFGLKLDLDKERAMAKPEAQSAKQEAKQDAFDALKPGKPRSIVIDGLVFIGGVGSLIYVLHTMAPN